MKRPPKEIYYLSIAKQIAKRSTCLRRRFGAIIVKNDVIVSTGYVGAPRGSPNCIDLKKCLRNELGIKSGERYELCRSVHAEANALINAARSGTNILNGTLYLYGENTNDTIIEAKPCKMCRRMIINAGITEVIVATSSGPKKYKIAKWIQETKKNPFKELSEPGY